MDARGHVAMCLYSNINILQPDRNTSCGSDFTPKLMGHNLVP